MRVTVLKAVPSKSKPDRGAVTSFVEVINQAGEAAMTLKVVNSSPSARREAESGDVRFWGKSGDEDCAAKCGL